MKISGCIITKDEEQNIEQCIKSILPAIDELILVDTGSVDNTIEIAKKYNAKIFYFKWVNDFSAARNFAISKAKGDWIIFPDADEIISEEDVDKIRPMLKKMSDLVDAIKVRMYDSTRDLKNILCTYTNVRIFKNNKNLRYVGQIHEFLKKRNGNTRVFDSSELISFFHVGYDPSIVGEKNKVLRNLQLLEQQLTEKPENGNLHFYICNTYNWNENWDKVIEHGKLALQYGITLTGRDAMAYNLIVRAIQHRDGFTEEALALLNEGITKFIDYGDLYVLKADYFCEKELQKDETISWENAVKCFNHVNHNYPSHCSPDMLKQIYRRLGILYDSLDDVAKCIFNMSKALQVDKYDSLVAKTIIDQFVKYGEPKNDIVDYLNKYYTLKDDLLFITKCLIETNAFNLFIHYYRLLPDIQKEALKHIYYYANQNFEEALKLTFSEYKKAENNYLAIIIIMSAICCNDSNALLELRANTSSLVVKNFISYLLEEIDTPEESTVSLYKSLLEQSMDFGLSKITNDLISLKDDYIDPPFDEIGIVFYERKMYDVALEYFQIALEKEGSHKSYLYIYAARCNQKLKQFDSSMELLQQAIDNYQKVFIFYYELINLAEMLKRTSVLELVLQRSVKEFPESQWVMEKALEYGIENEKSLTSQ